MSGACERCGHAPGWTPPKGVGWTETRVAGVLRVCERCLASMTPERRAAELEARRRLERLALDRRRGASGVPAATARLRLRDLDVASAAIEAARRWSDGEIRGLLLTGPVGTGKTWTAAAAANRFLERDRLAWASTPALLGALSLPFTARQRERAQRTIVGDVPLVLDDMDKSRPSPTGAEAMFAAVDGRVAADAPLLVTTNLALGEMAVRWPTLGEAVASRLAGYCCVVELGGPDRRVAW